MKNTPSESPQAKIKVYDDTVNETCQQAGKIDMLIYGYA
jgi:hypothetical protein